MNKENEVQEDTGKLGQPTCNVNMTFNTIVGVISIAVALVIVYVAYMYLGK